MTQTTFDATQIAIQAKEMRGAFMSAVLADAFKALKAQFARKDDAAGVAHAA